MAIEELQLGKEQHGAIIGQNGTGKTFLAKYLIPTTGRLAIIDPKRTFQYPDVPIFQNAKEIIRRKPDRFIYRPQPDDLTNVALYDLVYKHIYQSGPIFCYTDEIIALMKKNTYPHYLQCCYCMARELGVRMLSTFQRPACIPLFLLSEASKFYAFTLNRKDDIRRVQEHVPGYNPPLPSKHSFVYYDQYGNEKATIMTLKPKVAS